MITTEIDRNEILFEVLLVIMKALKFSRSSKNI